MVYTGLTTRDQGMDSTVTPQEAALKRWLGEGDGRPLLRGRDIEKADIENDGSREDSLSAMEQPNDPEEGPSVNLVANGAPTAQEDEEEPEPEPKAPEPSQSPAPIVAKEPVKRMRGAQASQPAPRAVGRVSLFPRLAADAVTLQEVKEAIKHAWTNYKKDAWGMDNLEPLTHSGDNRFLGIQSVALAAFACFLGV
jgi:predicted RNase H-like HicB family nuclease